MLKLIQYTPEQRDAVVALGYLDFTNEIQVEGIAPTWNNWNGLGIESEVLNPEQITELETMFGNDELLYFGDYGGGGSGRPNPQ